MESKLWDKILEGGILGIILAIVLFVLAKKIDGMKDAVVELVALLKVHMGLEVKKVLIFSVLSLGLLLAGCATTISVEGCYFEEGIGRVCITATRAPDGVIDIKIHGDVQNILTPEQKRRILAYGRELVTTAERSPD